MNRKPSTTMSAPIVALTLALILLGAAAGTASARPAGDRVSDNAGDVLGPCNNGKPPGFELQSTILFTSNRDQIPLGAQQGAEIYSMNPKSGDVTRLTDNQFGEAFANLSPDGKRIVFDSNRLTFDPTKQVNNISDLFLMKADGTDQTLLTRGSSATWSPDCKQIAFHASASGTGLPIKKDPGAATSDSDIFVANVDDLLAGTGQPQNITNTGDLIEDDADWSVPTADAPDGRIAFTAHPVRDDPNLSNDAEIYVANPDGSDGRQLTGNNPDPRFNNIEERSPAWSPDGTRIVFSCRIGAATLPNAPFQICMMNADGSDEQQVTNDPLQTGQDLTPSWSPDGQRIVFHRNVPGQGFQLWTMNPDGTDQMQITSTPGISLLAHWGVLRVKG
jgi:Tol biopolymer transport system component